MAKLQKGLFMRTDHHYSHYRSISSTFLASITITEGNIFYLVNYNLCPDQATYIVYI